MERGKYLQVDCHTSSNGLRRDYLRYFLHVLQLLASVKKALIQGRGELANLVRAIFAGEYMFLSFCCCMK